MATIKSVEEKAKAYDVAFERAKEMIKAMTNIGGVAKVDDIQYLFPELKESEGERIRKELIEQVVFIVPNDDEVDSEGNVLPTYQKRIDKYLAWLEKQGEQKLYVSDNAKEMFIKALERVEEQNNKGYKLTDCDKNSWWEDFKVYTTSWQNLANSAKICKDEQEPTNKVEPKFKVGDWIIGRTTSNEPRQISEITDQCYKSTYGGQYGFSFEDEMHLWTIQDAKDGDVLNSVRVKATIIFKGWNPDGKHLDAYCALQKGILIKQEMLWDRDFEPATKEQRDLLFQKTHEAGYEWDADKKELKKIELTPVWSEEDKNHIIGITQTIGGAIKYNVISHKTGDMQITWLKSLK